MSVGALVVWALAAAAGCADNPMVMKGQLSQFQQQQAALTGQNQQLRDKATALDRDDQEVHILLAQSRQQAKVAEDQLAALREQLRGVTAQLAQLQGEKQNVEKKAEALTASLQRQGGVTINPNNSFLQTLPVLHTADSYVRRDGDVIRVELPGSRLFEAGGSQLQSGAANLLADAAAEIRRSYPDQIIGIEGHTDSDPVLGGQYRSNHELSVARAMTVYNALLSGGRFRADQLFVVGYGANRPVVSNATPAGKQRNRRVELVVYPERKG
ncbi:MAG: OmpA family protein [Thermoguttaceae bacterium]